MKKILSLAIVLMALVGFTACESSPNFEDPDYKGVYSYVVPCLQWNASMDEVRSYMKGVKGWNASSSQLGNSYLIYRQKKTSNNIDYRFQGGKLTRTTVIWYKCPDAFDRMRDEYAQKMGFTWEEYHGTDFISYTAVSNELNCDISLRQSELNGVAQMSIVFERRE